MGWFILTQFGVDAFFVRLGGRATVNKVVASLFLVVRLSTRFGWRLSLFGFWGQKVNSIIFVLGEKCRLYQKLSAG